MKRPYQITAVVFILFSAFIARDSMELKFYTALGPGPGFFPFWLSVLMMILAAMMFYNATFKNAGPMPDDFWASKVGYLRMLAIFLAIAFA
ncbi:MAG TPA: tripartite tricarboxylate transporter TctB family protein, partial [Chloroflexota bacterium]|nr:tripartite tricarboxylate transporter TctB family protein [Chloroflexota bacterium]